MSHRSPVSRAQDGDASVLSSSSSSASSRVTYLFELLKAQGTDSLYIGESISQLEHCLQTAQFAFQEGAEDEIVIAALLHDIGQFLPLDLAQGQICLEEKKQRREELEMIDDGLGSVGRKGHDKIGEDFLRAEGWPEKVCSLVGAHVVAKRYLTAVSPSYLSSLSSASKLSLSHQGGPFTSSQVETFHKDPLWELKIRLRRWDDGAKVVGMDTRDLESYRSMAERVWKSVDEGK